MVLKSLRDVGFSLKLATAWTAAELWCESMKTGSEWCTEQRKQRGILDPPVKGKGVRVDDGVLKPPQNSVSMSSSKPRVGWGKRGLVGIYCSIHTG